MFSAPGDGIDPAVMLTVGQRPKAQYLINVPEGFSRYVLEHKVRPGLGLRAVFCSDLMSATGISGLIMRLRGEGHGCIELMGPPGTFQFLTSLQHFIHWRHPAVLLTEINSHENYTMPLYSDEYMDVSPLWPGGGCPEWLSGLATKHDMARTHATYNDADYSDVLEQDQISCEGESSSTTSSSEEKDIRKKSSSLPSLMVREQRTQSVRMGENNCIVVHGRTYDQSNGEQDGGGRICTYRQREPVGENPSVTGLKGNSASMSFIFYVRTPMCNAICLYIHCTNVEEVEAWVRHPVCQILNNVWPSKR